MIESENEPGIGFFVAPDKIVTNIHVVAHVGPVFVKSSDKKKNWTIEGVIAFDTKSKLVVLKLIGEGTPLPLEDNSRVQIGESVSILNYLNGEFKATDGSIQSIRNSNKWLRVKTTTSKNINGSPVLNDNGQVIGVIVPYGGDPYSYAIPSSALERLLAQSIPIELLTEWQQRKHIRAEASYSLGVKKLDLKDYAGAIVDFDKAIELDAQHTNAYGNRGGAKLKFGESETARGNAKEAQRLYKAAIVDCDKAIEIDPEGADAYSHRGAAQFHLGVFASERGDMEKAQALYKGAIEDFAQVVHINPENAIAYYKRGIVKCKLGDIKSESDEAEIVQKLYHEGITDLDNYIRLKYPENVDEPVTDVASADAINSVVRIVSWDDNFSFGSVFFVERDKVATNIHVIARTGPVYVTLRKKKQSGKLRKSLRLM